jgi:DNA modification methylase
MDPFTGLGSTAVACARTGVSFIGAEIDETYLKEAVARMKDAGEERRARSLPQRGEARMRKAAIRERTRRAGKAAL